MKSGIYRIYCVASGKSYIGSAVDVKRRLSNHRAALGAGKHDNPRLQNAWNKYGADTFFFGIIEAAAREVLIEREQYWVAGCNLTDVETKLRCAALEVVNPRPETKAKLSAAFRGRKLSAEWRAKIGFSLRGRQMPKWILDRAHAGNVGRVVSAETRLMISRANKGRKPPLAAAIAARAKFTGVPKSREHVAKMAASKRVLTDDQVLHMARMRADGKTYQQIATEFKVGIWNVPQNLKRAGLM